MPKSYSDVPMGTQIRVQGRLGQSARGPVIMDATGVPLWNLSLPDDYAVPEAGRIIVEGVRSGFDRIDVDWIGKVDEINE